MGSRKTGKERRRKTGGACVKGEAKKGCTWYCRLDISALCMLIKGSLLSTYRYLRTFAGLRKHSIRVYKLNKHKATRRLSGPWKISANPIFIKFPSCMYLLTTDRCMNLVILDRQKQFDRCVSIGIRCTPTQHPRTVWLDPPKTTSAPSRSTKPMQDRESTGWSVAD